MADKSIVLITGGNTGIGYESVKALYASPQAHTILMGSRSLEKAAAAISQLKSEVSESKSEVVPIQIDIEDDSSIENAFKEVESKWGRVDALVNNAGTPPYSSSIKHAHLSSHRRSIRRPSATEAGPCHHPRSLGPRLLPQRYVHSSVHLYICATPP